MTTNEQTTLADRCARCDCAESGAPDMQALLADMRAQVVEAREERDVRETLVQQYRAQHDVEAQRRGCPFCTCDVCAADAAAAVLP